MLTYNCGNCGNTTACNCPNNPMDPPVVVCPNPLQCQELYNTDCIVYTGEDIPCLSIVTGESMTSVIQKIAAKICQCCTQPINCQVSEWSAWGPCICVSDNEGTTCTQTRTRTVLVPAQEGGEPCPDLTETRECTPCDVAQFELTNYDSSCRQFEVIIPVPVDCEDGDSYIVKWKTASGAWEESAVVTSCDLPFVIDTYDGDDLVAGTRYEVTVKRVCGLDPLVTSPWAVSQFYTLLNCFCETPVNLFFQILNVGGFPAPTVSMLVPLSATTISVQLFDLGPTSSPFTAGTPITAVLPVFITAGSPVTYTIPNGTLTRMLIFGNNYYVQVTQTCTVDGGPVTTLFNTNIVINYI
jgi:hypothetical protein